MAHDGHAGACRSILQALLQVEDLHTGANSSVSSSLQGFKAFHAHWQHIVGAHCSIINNKRGGNATKVQDARDIMDQCGASTRLELLVKECAESLLA